MKHFLYHVTPKENIPSIKREGLKRKGFAVYCSENPESWWTPDLAIFKVRITGLKCEMTTFLPESDEVLIWGDVPPERLYLCNVRDVIRRKTIKERSKPFAGHPENGATEKELPLMDIFVAAVLKIIKGEENDEY